MKNTKIKWIKMEWGEQLYHLLNEHDDDGDCREGMFGHNIDWKEKDVKRYLKKLEKLGITKIYFPDYYTVEFILPHSISDNKTFLDYASANVMLHILTTSPTPSETVFNKKKNKLTLSWHF